MFPYFFILIRRFHSNRILNIPHFLILLLHIPYFLLFPLFSPFFIRSFHGNRSLNTPHPIFPYLFHEFSMERMRSPETRGYSNQTWTVSSSMGSSHFTDITYMPLGVGRSQNVGLFLDFCHILTLLPARASVFHKHMSSWPYCETNSGL